VRGAAWVFGRVDEALVSRSSTPLPVPSERVARAVLLTLTLLTLAAFSVPWLA